ncbi:hypothetical protein EPUS_06158 [Endocarpon pusillum Z07020]|uniref:Elongator complex protein 5 n=1 Tax=Endocarpon pusillum (strain Z07020 / HMAS-L-300199) TaxID=1263415 RepID=U1GWM9_ENDPU|nr:uncharacterized protein EPUS_06158 [Endocarpon pusillum Z07020]ERF76496.1 hypothetical protein EPUS_06158 [Endocarpon pusillum Z07020]
MKRVVVYYDTAPELLESRLRAQQGNTTLIICSSKKQYLQQLIPFLSVRQPTPAVAFKEDTEAEDTCQSQRPHFLLDPTLQLMSISKATKLAFCPTINTLRAYLSSLAILDHTKSAPRASLMIVDLILLHHATSEFSVQGLMRSLASAVEAAARNQVDLQLCECRDVHDLENPDRGARLWDAQVPLLSGSVRLRDEDAGWSGRVISIRTIVGRWFEFEKTEEPKDDRATEDEEMLV